MKRIEGIRQSNMPKGHMRRKGLGIMAHHSLPLSFFTSREAAGEMQNLRDHDSCPC